MDQALVPALSRAGRPTHLLASDPALPIVCLTCHLEIY